MLLSGPFTQQIHDPGSGGRGSADLGGPEVRLVWVRSDAATLRRRLADRGSERDAAKLADFGSFAASMRLGDRAGRPARRHRQPPQSAAPLEAQVAALVPRAGPRRR